MAVQDQGHKLEISKHWQLCHDL